VRLTGLSTPSKCISALSRPRHSSAIFPCQLQQWIRLCLRQLRVRPLTRRLFFTMDTAGSFYVATTLQLIYPRPRVQPKIWRSASNLAVRMRTASLSALFLRLTTQLEPAMPKTARIPIHMLLLALCLLNFMIPLLLRRLR